MNSSILLMLISASMAVPAVATEYFVDSRIGADGNSGQAVAAAWKSLAPLRSRLSPAFFDAAGKSSASVKIFDIPKNQSTAQ